MPSTSCWVWSIFKKEYSFSKRPSQFWWTSIISKDCICFTDLNVLRFSKITRTMISEIGCLLTSKENNSTWSNATKYKNRMFSRFSSLPTTSTRLTVPQTSINNSTTVSLPWKDIKWMRALKRSESLSLTPRSYRMQPRNFLSVKTIKLAKISYKKSKNLTIEFYRKKWRKNYQIT